MPLRWSWCPFCEHFLRSCRRPFCARRRSRRPRASPKPWESPSGFAVGAPGCWRRRWTSRRQRKSRLWSAKTTRRVGSSVAAGNWSLAQWWSHRAGWMCLAPRMRGTYQPYSDWYSHGREDGDSKVGESATKGADKQSANRAGIALRMGCIVERIALRNAPRSYGSIGDRGASSTSDEQKWTSVS